MGLKSFLLLSVFFLHCEATLKGDFCTDVSFWDRISYKEENRCCSEGKTENNCVTKTEEVCADVTEMKCEATAWVECKPDPNAGAIKSCSPSTGTLSRRNATKSPTTSLTRRRFPSAGLSPRTTVSRTGRSTTTATRCGAGGSPASQSAGRSAT